MKKRMIAMLLAVALCVSVFAIPVSADTTVYVTDTGTKYHNAGCRYLADSSYAISLSTALSRGYTACSVCHAPTSAHVHSWDNGKVTTSPTCGKNGVRTYTCTGCGEKKTESIPATGKHQWNSGSVTTSATCAKTGVKTYTCKVCGKTKTESIPATGKHQWNSGSITTPATCAKTGVKTFTCKVCGKTKTETVPVNKNHSWNSGVVNVEPTETSDGKMVFTCKNCGAKKEQRIPAVGYPFDDIPSDSYCWLPAKWAYENGIATGLSATSFGPDKTCTRAQVVTFLWRAFGEPEPSSNVNPFKDVRSGEYYYKAVLWAVERGITNGTSTTAFSPDLTVTRGQSVTFLWRAFGSPAASCNVAFNDIKETEYYYPAVLWAVSNGITNGTGVNTFSPSQGCTRGQIVTFLNRTFRSENKAAA